MTTQHTPGPCACTFEIVPTDPSGRIKGHIFGGFRVVRYCPLHQAAPDLLAALEKSVAFISTWRDCLAGVQLSEADFRAWSGLQEARAAVAKATGEQS